MRKIYNIKTKRSTLTLGKNTKIMGILNATPDSFSDGGKYQDSSDAVTYALQMELDGADIIDIGGESTRPGCKPVSAEEEIDRVLPLIEGIRKKSNILISIDTYKAEVAEAAVTAGADIINDISGANFDPEMPKIAAKHKTPIILMHIKGTPKNMQKAPYYQDLFREIIEYLKKSIERLEMTGLNYNKIIIDPGIGFGKTVDNNLKILNHLNNFLILDRPLLIGTSRKSTIGQVTGRPVNKREFGTAATISSAISGGAHIVRVHNVKDMKDVVTMTDAIINS